MARSKSVILTPAEKKTVIVDLKGKIKAAKDAVKAVAALNKEVDKKHAAACKTHEGVVKARAKAGETVAKELSKMEAQLASLTAPAVPAAPKTVV